MRGCRAGGSDCRRIFRRIEFSSDPGYGIITLPVKSGEMTLLSVMVVLQKLTHTGHNSVCWLDFQIFTDHFDQGGMNAPKGTDQGK